MKFRAFALAGALLAATAPAAVCAQSYNASQVKKSVQLDDLKAVVKELGHTVVSEGEDGPVSLVVEDEYGIIYLLIGTACDMGGVSGCQGIMMQARYDISDGVTVETINKANLAYAALSTWIDQENDQMGFTRYQVLDDGVTMANIKANVLVLLGVSEAALEVAKGNE